MHDLENSGQVSATEFPESLRKAAQRFGYDLGETRLPRLGAGSLTCPSECG